MTPTVWGVPNSSDLGRAFLFFGMSRVFSLKKKRKSRCIFQRSVSRIIVFRCRSQKKVSVVWHTFSSFSFDTTYPPPKKKTTYA